MGLVGIIRDLTPTVGPRLIFKWRDSPVEFLSVRQYRSSDSFDSWLLAGGGDDPLKPKHDSQRGAVAWGLINTLTCVLLVCRIAFAGLHQYSTDSCAFRLDSLPHSRHSSLNDSHRVGAAGLVVFLVENALVINATDQEWVEKTTHIEFHNSRVFLNGIGNFFLRHANTFPVRNRFIRKQNCTEVRVLFGLITQSVASTIFERHYCVVAILQRAKLAKWMDVGRDRIADVFQFYLHKHVFRFVREGQLTRQRDLHRNPWPLGQLQLFVRTLVKQKVDEGINSEDYESDNFREKPNFAKLAKEIIFNSVAICSLLAGTFFFTAIGLWQFYAPRYVEVHEVVGWLPWGILALGLFLIVVGQGCLWLCLWLLFRLLMAS